jgi:cell division septation protein DedD
VIKDYAYKPRVATVRPRQTKLIVALSCLLIVVFAIALLSASSSQEVTMLPIGQVEPIISVEEVKVMPKVKAQPKPGFEYTEMLKQATVTPAYVKEYESTPKDPNKKTESHLQVASFKSESDAKELQKLLINKQLPNVEVSQSTTESGSVWFKVMVGPFQNRSMLNKAQDILVQMNYSPLELKKK